jgi:hypothetical protein
VLALGSGRVDIRASLSEFSEKFGGWHEEGISLEYASQDHHRMRSQDVHRSSGAKLGAVVRSYNRVFVFGQDEIQTRFVFHEVVHTWEIFKSPLHMSDEPCQRVTVSRAGRQDFLYQG